MKNLYTILEGIFDIDNNIEDIDHAVFIEKIKKAYNSEAKSYDALWKDMLSDLFKNAKRINIGDLHKLLKNSNKKYIVIHRNINGYITCIRIYEGASRYPKLRTYEKDLRDIYLEYHIDLTDGYSYGYGDDDECYLLPKEYEWLFEIKK